MSLQSQDIIGLGFNICGNLRDGIFVSQVHNRGPASESGLIKPGKGHTRASGGFTFTHQSTTAIVYRSLAFFFNGDYK